MSALHRYYVILHCLAALWCYLLCRDLGRSKGASIFSGLVFGLAGYVGSTDWPQMLNGVIWAPLVLLFLFRVGRGRTPVASGMLAGFFLGVSWLSGHHQAPIFLSLAFGGFWLYFILRNRRIDWAAARIAVLAILMMLATGALQILPAYEYGNRARRWVGLEDPVSWNEKVPYKIHKENSLAPVSLLGVLIPGMNANIDAYLGVTVCSLALFGLSRLKEIAEVRQLFCLGIGGLFLSLGGYGLLHGILYSLAPLVEKARNVAAAIFLFQLAAAVLAAFGIDSFPAAERWVKYISRALLVMVAFVAGVMLLFALTLKTDLHPLITVSAFYALLLALVIRSWRSGFLGRGLAVAALITLFLSDHANARFFSFSDKFGEERQKRVKALSENSDIVDYLRRFLHDGRVDYDSKLIPYNIGDWHGIETYGAYLASVTDNILRHEFPNPRVYDLFGVRFLIRDEPSRPDQELVFTSATGIKVYRNPNAFRRHWTVHRVMGVRDAKEVNSHLFDAKFDPRQTALVVGEAPALETCPGADELVVLSRTPNTVVLAVQMACRGMLIVADTYFPGWEATVDGRPVRIHEAYDMIRGIVVDAGPHRVEMRYRPWSVRLGALLTGLATLAACAAWWRSRRG